MAIKYHPKTSWLNFFRQIYIKKLEIIKGLLAVQRQTFTLKILRFSTNMRSDGSIRVQLYTIVTARMQNHSGKRPNNIIATAP